MKHFRRSIHFFVFIILFFSLYGCNSEQSENENLRLLHLSNEKQRHAHLTGNAEMLANEIADSMITVSRGNLFKNSNKEIFKRFNNYFQSVQYIKWDDLEKPIINISDDGTLAEMILKKIILLKNKNEEGLWQKGATLFSWTAVYKKFGNKWKIISNTSTREDFGTADYEDYLNKGLKALEQNNLSEYKFNIEHAYYLAQNNATILFEYSKALTAQGNYNEAINILKRLAEIRFIGLNNFQNNSSFYELRQLKEYKSLLSKIAYSEKPINYSTPAFTIREKDLVPEGLAFDNNTGTLYLSSAYKRKIIAIDKSGSIRDFKSEAEEGLFSTWGMEVDEARNHLWVISSNTVQGMLTKIPDNDSEGICRVYKYDTVTGKLLKFYSYDKLNEKHFFNDLTISRNGDVYITESLTSKIYCIPREKDEIELMYQADSMFYFLNGLALNEDENKLFVTSSEGISVLDLKTLNWQLLQIPKNVCLEGIDGLTFYKSSLIAQQSGYPNNSVMQYYLDSTDYKIVDFRILESGNPLFDSATTGEIAGDSYYYIANSQIKSAFQWDETGPKEIKSTGQLNDIVILKVKIEE